jgi:murein DD-endopeptidase MepM/ murein hydrolase activator NlpD
MDHGRSSMKSLLLFLAGVLVGANLVYFAMHRARAPDVDRIPDASMAPADRASAGALPSTPATKAPVTTATPATAVSPASASTITAASSLPTTTSAPPATGAPPNAPLAASSTPPPPPGALLLPVAGIRADQLTDTFNDSRDGTRRHEALDIMAPRGTPVLAASDGTVAKLFTSVPGGLTIYEFDPTGTYAYYYAHLDRYAPGLANGKPLKRGEVIGYVGSTGNASPDAPHLHFAIFVLGPEKQWWKGTAIDPYPLLARRSP